MNLLAIDCSASLCAACIVDTKSGDERGRHLLDLGKGHAEHLMGVVEAAMTNAGIGFGDLGAIGVSVGPGSFTGIRVSVSAARGFALALAIPSVGVTTLAALAAQSRSALGARPVLSALVSGPDNVQCAGYDALGVVWHHPVVMTTSEAAELAKRSDAALAGTAARAMIAAIPGWAPAIGVEAATADIAVYARLAIATGLTGERPKPLYLREPDAKPQAGFILQRSDDDGVDPAPERRPGG